MQKWTALLFAALVLGAVGIVLYPAVHRAAPPAATPADAGAPPTDGGPAAPPTTSAGDPPDAEPPTEAVPPVEGEQAGPVDAGGTLLLSGDAPPALAGDAPKSVIFGVILVQYRGTQLTPTSARSREEALTLAKQLAQEAKTDFKAAVAKGDKGSMENAGRLPRGVLEPAPEYVLFSLPKGGVSDPVDTPRGFWIVQRIE
jgi:hypothetical protein